MPVRFFESTGLMEAACILTRHSPGFLVGSGLRMVRTEQHSVRTDK